jgi:D-glycero-D-manno-heptose 1,7-bisphosphate phosphatase
MHPAIFLDRDGVIIENRPDYVRSWAEVEIFPQALATLVRLARTPYKVVIVTNQAGIGKGLIPPAVSEDINRRLQVVIEQAGGRIDGIYVCPHRPDDRCDCRKPLPGLIHQAAAAFDLDLPASILIGDALSDLQAGRAAGVGRLALVRTGRGTQQSQMAGVEGLRPFEIYTDLSEACTQLIPDGS